MEFVTSSRPTTKGTNKTTINGAHVLVLVFLLALLVAALVLCWRSTTRDTPIKVIWTVLIVVLPLFGPVVFLAVELLSLATRRRA